MMPSRIVGARGDDDGGGFEQRSPHANILLMLPLNNE